jgi:hypothetical protein
MLSLSDWSAGIDFEINFWSEWMSTKGGQWPGEFADRQDPYRQFDAGLRQLVADRVDIKALDVGSGQLTSLGSFCSDASLNLRACDPLASIYNTFIEKYGLKPPVRTEFAMAEENSAHSSMLTRSTLSTAETPSIIPPNRFAASRKC